jgi:hypothetical protein
LRAGDHSSDNREMRIPPIQVVPALLSRISGAAVLSLLLAIAVGCSNPLVGEDEPEAAAFDGAWVDFENSAHTLEVEQGEDRGQLKGFLRGTETFAPDGPTSPFAGPFFGGEMIVTVERPDGPVVLVGEMIENGMMLMKDDFGAAFLWARREDDSAAR